MMRLRVILPDRVLVDTLATKIAAEGAEGAFTLLPRHLDYASILVPGLLTYTDQQHTPVYLAVDSGTLVKCASDVRVSVRHATRSDDLDHLRRIIHEQFLTVAEGEREARTALASLELDLVRRFVELGKNS